MKLVRIKFKALGKRYFFGLNNFDVKENDKVIVSTIRGTELGFVVGEPFEMADSELPGEIKDILRIATKDDISRYDNNHKQEPEIIQKTKEFVKKNQLDMKVLGAEYTLDRSKLIIYFEAEGRVDFRELVKDLADCYRTRIELRQVGSRDGAKAFGGIGPCGLVVCCQTFITEFDNVSVKMAKNQNLSLNPVKISGNCGKLLCCINYEDEYYKELRKNAPDAGDIVADSNGLEAKVLSCDVLNKVAKVKYLVDEKFGYLKFDELKIVKAKIKNKRDDDGDVDGGLLE